MATKLPISRVVLYQHGVASVERRGQVKGSDLVHLDIAGSALDDVLTSLVTIDLAGGQVSTISYDAPTDDASAVRLKVPPEGSLTSLLGQLQGARVRGKLSGQYVEGMVVGVDTAELPSASGTATVRRQLLTLMHEGALRTYDLLEIKELALSEDTVRKDVEAALASQLHGRRQDVRRITLSAEGNGRREVFVSYATPARPWRSSYRALLSDAEPPLLQGFGELENATEEDWEAVQVVLALPAPPTTEQPSELPTEPEQAAAQPSAPTPSQPGTAVPPSTLATSPEPVVDMFPDDALIGLGPTSAQSSAPQERSSARGRRVGEVFEYQLGGPVTLRRGQRGLVPLFQDHVEGSRALLFEHPADTRHPRACLELRNTTTLVLAAGPIAVFEQGRFLGRGQVEALAPDEGALVPFGLEHGCSVGVEEAPAAVEIETATVAGADLQLRQRVGRERRFLVHNGSPREQVLYIQHHRDEEWEVVDTSARPEPTREGLWFRFELAPFAEQTLVIREKTLQTRMLPLTDPSAGEVLEAMGRGEGREVVALLDGHRQHARALERTERDHADTAREQERLRANLAALDETARATPVHHRLLERLGQLEGRLSELHTVRETLRAEAARTAEALQTRLRSLLGRAIA